MKAPATLNEKANLSIDELKNAAVPDTTKKLLVSRINQFVNVYRGTLPTYPAIVMQYLHDHQQSRSIETLKKDLWALSRWHLDAGFADPTDNAEVRLVLKGIKNTHLKPTIKAHALVLPDIEKIVEYINYQLAEPNTLTPAQSFKLIRDKALLLLMFWRGFRASALVSIKLNQIERVSQDVWVFHMSPDKNHQDFWLAKLYATKSSKYSLLCPIAALEEYIELANLKSEHPFFSKASRGGNLTHQHMKPASLNGWIKNLAINAGLTPRHNRTISSHSMRRGFATEFAPGLGEHQLMKYLGWKSVSAAREYIDDYQLDDELAKIAQTLD